MFFNRATKRNDSDTKSDVAKLDVAKLDVAEPTQPVAVDKALEATPPIEAECPSSDINQPAEVDKTEKTAIPETMTALIQPNPETVDTSPDDDFQEESTVEYIETMDESTILTHLLITAMKKLDIPPSVSPDDQAKWLGEQAAIAALTAFETVFEDNDGADSDDDEI